MLSQVMGIAHDYLVKKGKSAGDMRKFKHQLYDLWFKLYRRTRGSRAMDSSGFEHVFVGETRGKDVIGFHNWIQFYLQEKAGNVDYQGYILGKRVMSVRRKPILIPEPLMVARQFRDQSFLGKPIILHTPTLLGEVVDDKVYFCLAARDGQQESSNHHQI